MSGTMPRNGHRENTTMENRPLTIAIGLEVMPLEERRIRKRLIVPGRFPLPTNRQVVLPASRCNVFPLCRTRRMVRLYSILRPDRFRKQTGAMSRCRDRVPGVLALLRASGGRSRLCTNETETGPLFLSLSGSFGGAGSAAVIRWGERRPYHIAVAATVEKTPAETGWFSAEHDVHFMIGPSKRKMAAVMMRLFHGCLWP